jgi:DnaK suppressor protein
VGDDRKVLADRLDDRRAVTERQLAALTRDFDEIVESSALSPPDDEHDPDGTTIAFERAQITALVSQARAELASLDRALEQVREGTYGSCAVCGQPIGEERLDALPTTERCRRCAT